jgi:hypothetical protein
MVGAVVGRAVEAAAVGGLYGNDPEALTVPCICWRRNRKRLASRP